MDILKGPFASFIPVLLEYVLSRINVILKILGWLCLGIYKVVFSMVWFVKTLCITYFSILEISELGE